MAVAPGIGFGEHGDDYVRFALVENRHRTRQAICNIKTFLGRYHNVVELRRSAPSAQSSGGVVTGEASSARR